MLNNLKELYEDFKDFNDAEDPTKSSPYQAHYVLWREHLRHMEQVNKQGSIPAIQIQGELNPVHIYKLQKDMIIIQAVGSKFLMSFFNDGELEYSRKVPNIKEFDDLLFSSPFFAKMMLRHTEKVILEFCQLVTTSLEFLTFWTLLMFDESNRHILLDLGEPYKIERSLNEDISMVTERVSKTMNVEFIKLPTYRKFLDDMVLYTSNVRVEPSRYTSLSKLEDTSPELSAIIKNLQDSEENKAQTFKPDMLVYENALLSLQVGIRATMVGAELVMRQAINSKTIAVERNGKSLEDAFSNLIHSEEFKQFDLPHRIKSWFVSKVQQMKKDLSEPLKRKEEKTGKPSLMPLAKDLELNTVQWRPLNIELDDEEIYVGILHNELHLYFKLSSLTVEEDNLFNQWMQKPNIAKIIWDATLEQKHLPKLKPIIDLQLIFSTGSNKKALGAQKYQKTKESNFETLKIIEMKYAKLITPLY
jgi:hypothetical protein